MFVGGYTVFTLSVRPSVRPSVLPHKQMGTPVAIKFGQLDTQVVIFEYKCDLFRKFDTLVAKIDSCVSKPHIGK